MPPVNGHRVLISLIVGGALLGLTLFVTWERYLESPPSTPPVRTTVLNEQWASLAASAPEGLLLTGPDSTIGGDFDLLDQHAHRRTLASFLESYLLVFFGYTYCPDICPQTLATASLAMGRLSPQERQQIRPIFISLDPQRDTPPILRSYLSNFDSTIVGLTGTPDTVESAAKSFKVLSHKVKSSVEGGYLINHTAFLYILDREQSRVVAMLRHDDSIDTVARGIRWTMQQIPARSP